MRLWQPPQVEVVSMAQELGSMPSALGVPAESAAQSGATPGGWTIVNDFGRTINPWGPSGFAGAVDDRY
jgi:hypothetical protein